ncbi:hypothetical protein ccbrp13_56080 [Ktedonobacteria bacterium brp13]|nr:hypothetical protein ccbrp13_56080 [Ktedonobacteria bacterium brp13]
MSEHTDFLLKLHLEAIVPLMIADIANQGDISDWQLERVSGHAVYLGEHGDAILYRVKGETRKAVNVLCESLAILAFAPGGITFAGIHFEGQPAFEEILVDMKELQTSLAGVEV